MQLIYLYIDGYRNFHQTEFIFSPDICMHFDEKTGILEVSETHFKLPERFWGENINNFSVVVGNNGVGKTSLMQYIIGLFLEIHGHGNVSGKGILIFREDNNLYGYCTFPIKISTKSGKYKEIIWLKEKDEKHILENTKLVYLTNALTIQDYIRSRWYKSNRFTPLYDCSIGNLFAIDVLKDTEQGSPFRTMEVESYFLYEQYKQIKFVFDKHQRKICSKLKSEGYPMPVPKRLYIELSLNNHLSGVLDDSVDIFDNYDGFSSVGLDERVFSELYPTEEGNQKFKVEPSTDYAYIFLRKQLGRCAVWCAVTSAARVMDKDGKFLFETLLDKWTSSVVDIDIILEDAWEKIIFVMKNRGMKKNVERWETLKERYRDFICFINDEKLENHFKIETKLKGSLKLDSNRESITFSVDTKDSDWFMEFLYKYRYICNPDYFLDFYWGLSSGENSLMSLFASLYYVYDANYTTQKNEDYQILNVFEKERRVQCNSIILLIDEADLTYHPEWQRVFVGLLTAFLPRLYPLQCCRDIQIILSTHSPILLGDVPQKNVIYLRWDSEYHRTIIDRSYHEGTFGQNIHILFKDSFFLNNGTIGLFAENKIREFLKKLEEIKKVLEIGTDGETLKVPAEELRSRLEYECRPYAELIAEPIIRRKVLMEINELERKLELKKDEQDNELCKLSNEELKRKFSKIKKEIDRRSYDSNNDI